MRKSKSASLCLAFVALAFFLASCGAGEGGFYFPSARTGGEQLKEKSKMEIWAHRGCSYCYPENTLQAFKAAAALPVTGIEFDVQLTKDKKVVVIHDERVDRTTDGNGNVRDFTLQELQALKIKAPSGFERVPTLEEVLELLKPYCLKKNLRLNIELKTSRVRYEGIEVPTRRYLTCPCKNALTSRRSWPRTEKKLTACIRLSAVLMCMTYAKRQRFQSARMEAPSLFIQARATTKGRTWTRLWTWA